ncbi:GntR family transcriptional regulator [Yinghuangia sp. ASG 101]|uniref:FadR/GntR family transcriptional regulator n=1 Tax=Yinghuangia sp. ASG 101 TaxID=2896848 RepID=UPI001E3FB2B6|nr:FCD domain-containing protein [Yinghuangia sp. ASG 101]UGQ09817.1 GntR family transcriptional regulator [Yinghuangia sp. ASG 101]
MSADAASPTADAVFRPVRTGNAFEETVERLMAAIKLGVVPPGARFPSERELAARLGVSRITLREALHALRQAGRVEVRRGRFGGTFVTLPPPLPPTAEVRRRAEDMGPGLEDALAFRRVLEVGAVQVLATTALDDAQRELLLTRLDAVDHATPEDYRRLDTAFHLTLAELTGSCSLTAAAADVRMRLNELLDAIPVLARNIEHSATQHAAIVRAILAPDPEAARRATTQHLDATAALLRGFLAPTPL